MRIPCGVLSFSLHFICLLLLFIAFSRLLLIGMIAKIKRRECLEKYQKFPQVFNVDESYYPKVISEYVLVLPITSVDKYSSKLAQQFTLLI